MGRTRGAGWKAEETTRTGVKYQGTEGAICVALGKESKANRLVWVESCLGKRNTYESLLYPLQPLLWCWSHNPNESSLLPHLPLSFTLENPRGRGLENYTIVELGEIALGTRGK